MAAELEKLALELKERGFDGISSVVRSTAQLAREIGVPENFQQDRTKEFPLSDLEVSPSKIIDALFMGMPAERPGLSPELAEHFNRVLGADLPDATPMRFITYPDTEVITSLPRKQKEQANSISKGLKAGYTRVINAFIRARITTVGEFRITNANDLYAAMIEMKIGRRSVDFFRIALQAKTE